MLAQPKGGGGVLDLGLGLVRWRAQPEKGEFRTDFVKSVNKKIKKNLCLAHSFFPITRKI